jgi:hypothetical protein
MAESCRSFLRALIAAGSAGIAGRGSLYERSAESLPGEASP